MAGDAPPVRSPAGLPAWPALRPGLHVVRRDDRHLQVGIDPPHRLVVPDDPDTRRVLEALRVGTVPTVDTGAARRLVADLLAHGLVIDAAALDDALAGATDRAAVAATFAEHGDDAVRRLALRAAARIAVDAPPEPGQAATRLLRASGVGTVDPAEDADAVLVRLRGGDATLAARRGPAGRSTAPRRGARARRAGGRARSWSRA